MSDMLKTLAIEVTQHIDKETLEELARQAAEAKEKKMWIIILCIALAAELIFVVGFPKIQKKYQDRKAADDLRKAERKRIQSKRKR